MSYQVIARKYRPQRFEDVVGQDHVTQTLGNAIRSGRIAHAYLFCGPRGTGKTTIARIFAKALNCTDGPKADFDNDDPRCREIAEGRSLDVLEIDGASNNGVEQVRELRETARFAPASSRFKIYIIDEVHMLTTAAFNALLKTLEEPPAHVKFLFATTDPEKVLPTILSRCQRFDLRRIPNALISGHLAAIARTEGIAVAEGALHAIARGADGGLRDAESTLDQLISFCGDTIEEADVLSIFGLAAHTQLLALSRGILQGETETVLREVDTLARNGKDLGRLLNDLLHHFRNLLVFQVAQQDLSLLEVSEIDAAELREQSPLAPADAVIRVLEVLTAAEGRLRDAVARKIFLEVTLLKAIRARNAVPLDAVLQQLQQLRQEAGSGEGAPTAAPASRPLPSAPAPQPAPSSRTPTLSPQAASKPAAPAIIPAPPTSITPSAPGASSGPSPGPGAGSAPAPAGGGDPEVIWQQVVASAGLLTRAALQAGVFQDFTRGVLTVGYGPGHDGHRALLDQERTRQSLESRLAEAGLPAKLRFVRLEGQGAAPSASAPPVPGGPSATATPSGAAAPASASRPAPAPRARTRPEKAEKVEPIKVDPAEFKNDPLIREAIEIFRGQLVDVRPPGAGDSGEAGE